MALTKETKLPGIKFTEQQVRLLKNDRISMNPGEAITYPFSELMPIAAEVPLYDPATIDVKIWVRDGQVSSPMYNYDVPGDTVVATGIKPTGDVKIVNNHTSSLNVLVRVTIRRKPLQ